MQKLIRFGCHGMLVYLFFTLVLLVGTGNSAPGSVPMQVTVAQIPAPDSTTPPAQKSSEAKTSLVSTLLQGSQQKSAGSASLQQPTAAPLAVVASTIAAQQGAALVAAAQASPFQNKFKEVSEGKIITEKILGAKDLLALVTAATLVFDKNLLIGFCNDLFGQQGLMKKKELAALQAFFTDVVKNQFLLAANQVVTVNDWIKSLATSLELVTEDFSLLDSVKQKLNIAKIGFPTAIKAAFSGLQLLDSKIPPAELVKQTKEGLAGMLRAQMHSFFNARAKRVLEEVLSLKNFFNAAAKIPSLADAIDKTWEARLAVTQALASIESEIHILVKINSLNALSKTLKATTDQYEKKLFLDEIGKIVNKRKERAVREIEELNILLITLTSDAFKKDKIFSESDIKRMFEWRKLLTNSQILLTAQQEPRLDQKLKLLREAMLWLGSSEFIYEKDMFVSLLSEIFAQRVDFKVADLKKVKAFFGEVSKNKGILALNQLQTLNVWLTELDQASNIATNDKSYLEALLNIAVATKSIAQLNKALVLIIRDYNDKNKSYHNPKLRNIFVNVLNTLFTDRKSLDKASLTKLLLATRDKKVEGIKFLESAQLDVLNKWLEAMAKE